ncbi:VPLPA-CTERM sorting domain-containing protein [Paracoccus sp. (in: a-proteobacteria)]|uniref:VPLPA-CTERM sorting domain-containing protein n=1 Tax=Paracoccus sp. TaxID=267 RepID=UPI0026DF950E|nr:VPLPA-CTERM sorting domain-containing protein [Paracoccus sp. (in: a-proteobacteria)]MDO5647637.1 VPLPA-CTERM sorting domain-containing protein [Paracoccus sp. (in: a-proteobacteria)]
MRHLVFSAILAVAASPALSATLDFSDLTAPLGAVVATPGATLIAEGKGVRVSVDGITGSMAGDFCFIDSINSCAGSGRIDFDSDFIAASLWVHGLQSQERVTISALYRGATITSQFFEGTGLASTPFQVRFDGLFDSLTFVDTSSMYRNGVSYADVTITPAPVPLPAAGLMLLSGFGAAAAIARRRKS